MSETLNDTIKRLLKRQSEEEWFEFKQNWFEPAGIGEYISSLSNSAALLGREYAYLVWGVDNDTHRVIGTKVNYRTDVKNEPLEHFLARKLTPDINFRFHETKIDGKRVVVLVIPAASNVPTAFDGVRYLRVGSSKVNLSRYPERESYLFDILRNGLPTIENTASEYQDLTFEKLLVYYASKGIILNRRTFKRNLGLYTKNGEFNILAQLLSDDSHIPVRFAIFTGRDKTSLMHSVREFGYTCLLLSLDKVLEYGDLLNIPQADERNRVVERKEVNTFSPEAWREAVINAFAHNRWLGGNAPMFAAFSDRIEITSMGNLPPGQTKEGFYAGISVPVNQKLSDILLQLHISERTGRGVPRITREYGKEAITFHDGFITVALPREKVPQEDTYVENTPDEGVSTPDNTPDGRGNAPDNTPEKEAQIIAFCQTPKGILEIAEHLGFSQKKSVRKYLKPLLTVGRIAMTIPDRPKSKHQKYITIR